jgi:hypothetical protein
MTKQPFEVAGLTAAPGQRASSVLELSFAGTPIKMPLFVLNGAHDGPTVIVTAGIHGAEYVGIESAYRLAQQTDPQTLSGQLVVAPISSMNAFAKRAIYLCPPDNKNLNRMFPGKADGTFAEQLAYWIFQNLIRRANFYIDLHGGDMNEALVPFSIVRRSGNAELDAQSLALAQAFGLPNIVGSVVNGSTYAAAVELGIPSVLAEVGGQGLWPEEQVQYMGAGLRRAVAHAGLLPQPSGQAAPATRLLEEMVWMRSSHDGLFYPSIAVGETVIKGQPLGRITDYLGVTAEELIAPASGVILFLVTTLAMNNGDPLLAVGA